MGEYDIEYRHRVAIKAQALSDFLSEMVQPNEEEVWKVFVDGASSLDGSEYEAVLAGIQAAGEVGASRIILYSDSQLITQQIKGVYEAKDDRMIKYLQLIKARAEVFVDWGIEQIHREENGEADTLTKIAASLSEVSNREVLHVSRLILSIEKEILLAPGDSWMTPLIKFIVNNELPDDRTQAQKTKRQAPRWIMSSERFMKGVALSTSEEYLWPGKQCLLFGVPRRLISDNGRQFQGKGITSWCREMKIAQSFTSVPYPQANGQTEVVNRIIVQALKTRLQVLPVEIGQTSSRVESYPDDNDQARAMELDLVEEKIDRAFIRMEAYRSRVMKSYNKKFRIRDFQVGDLVMNKVNPAGDVRKLEARWEGPYKIT
ncbi:uncharacterized protein LOC142505773 [Primulina tabacum]|uniref:uncharacterized protein LOC142505773 n=1 Tax=Primulina tabacum TaxID=48773 RepID=UPI003F5A7AD8